MISIELSSEKDFEEIAKIYSEEFSKAPYGEPWTLEKALDKLKLFAKYCDIWKINYENKIAGFIVINPNQWCPGEVIFGEEMAIKESLQRKGIASYTLEKIFEIYSKKGYKIYYGIVLKDSKSLKMHEKLGAKISKEQLIMEKKLK